MGTQQMELLLNMEESNYNDQVNLYEKLSIWKGRTKIVLGSDWLVGLDKLNVSGYKFKITKSLNHKHGRSDPKWLYVKSNFL